MSHIEQKWNELWETRGWAALPLPPHWRTDGLKKMAVGPFCCIEVQPNTVLGMEADYAFLAEYHPTSDGGWQRKLAEAAKEGE